MKTNKNGVELAIKGAVLIFSFLMAIINPDILKRFFTYSIFSSIKTYHILWLLTVLILLKRFIPSLNKKINLGKIYSKNYKEAGPDSPSKRERLLKYKRKIDNGAIRSAVYWVLLVLTMWLWRKAQLLSDLWIFIIVIFFIFMDEFCATIWCPFQAIISNKCCNTCRINNWGYLMAFSPMIFIQSFWTYSILMLSVLAIVQWEYLYHKHPERFYELYNANLMCKNCTKKCRKRS
ncbi:MAG TPA: hypothetical protein PLW88_00545 [Syntrophorhabdaceae bacterium]|nr:hypothetical protein [Syntrophorhabdaceae bacterium]HPP05827.1 hypothetical protein [Syntrophorhabdaceae bacterium]